MDKDKQDKKSRILQVHTEQSDVTPARLKTISSATDSTPLDVDVDK